MNATKFKSLLQLNRELSNTLHTMSDEDKATIKGGKTFVELHKTDLQISSLTTQSTDLQAIVERGDY